MKLEEVTSLSKVKISLAHHSYTGLLLPKEGDYIVLKLSSGYNMGIDPKNIKEFSVLAAPKQTAQKTVLDIQQDDTLPRVRVLHTGGTIASKIDYETGGVVAAFDPEELIVMFPELTQVAFMEAQFVGNMQSDDFRFAHFNKIAKAVLAGIREGTKRFIVTSGTDFLHYLSSALSFLLKDVPVGVLVVGSQRSSDRGSSDAAMNLICATQFLAEINFQGVATCLHGTTNDDVCHIISGTNVRKMHSSKRDAFKAINDEPLAIVNYMDKSILLNKPIQTRKKIIPKQLPLFKEDIKIGMLYSRPQLFEEELAIYEHYDGLILVGSGLGHFPITEFDKDCTGHLDMRKTLAHLAKKMPVAMAVQTIYGRTHLNVYSPQRTLRAMGILGHLSLMTPETSFIKLAWLLSNYTQEEVRELYMKDIVGEQHEGESNKQ